MKLVQELAMLNDIEQPQSHSVPNMAYKNVQSDEDDMEDEIMAQSENDTGGNYVPVEHQKLQFQLDRDFKTEVQNYFMLKQEQFNRKQQLQSGIYEDNERTDRGVDRGPLIDETAVCRICDLGNGCWTHYHFTQKIQTRQYRGPEIMLGIDYDASADLWSFACMIFELITGEFLFDPRKGPNYKKTDDHLALMIEMLGPMPKNYAMSGKFFDQFFELDPAT